MRYRKMISILTVFLFTGILFVNSIYARPVSLDLNSPAKDDASFIAVDETFETADGLVRKLIMTGLKPENKNLMLQCLTENYRESDNATPLKIIDRAFCDAEKWDNEDYDNYYDVLQCWAASAANMLWISGWAEYLDYPEGMKPFSSEDEIFRIYNNRFTDEGVDISSALDWFFMGEFFITGMKKSANLLYNYAEDGFLKSFVSSLAQTHYDLTADASDIQQLLRIGPSENGQTKGQSVFQASIGNSLEGELLGSEHSVTVAGVIIDPQAQTLQDRFKAIIIIDSDNDAHPDKEESALVEAVTAEDEGSQDLQRIAEKEILKAERPDSYTVYALNYMTSSDGTECWEIVDYSEPLDEYWDPTILYAINELPLPTDELMEDLREEDGSLDHMNDPDFSLDVLFMTGDPEGFTDPYFGRINETDEAIVSGYTYGDPVRLNYFVSNRSSKSIEADGSDEGCPYLTWKVTRDSDGSLMAEGTDKCKLPIYKGLTGGTEAPNIITLNESNGELQFWDAGTYTLTAQINADHSVREAYYKNNLPQTLHFTILAD